MADEVDCKVCTDPYPKDLMVEGVCIFCRRKKQFAALVALSKNALLWARQTEPLLAKGDT